MKRYLVLCVLLIFLIPCITVPASASQWGSDDVEDIIGSVQTIESDLYSWFEQWYAYFLEATESVYDVSGAETFVTPFKYDLIQVQMYVWSWTSSIFDTISSNVSSLKSQVTTYFPKWEGYFTQMNQRLQTIAYWVEYYPSKIAHYFSYKEHEMWKYTYQFSNGEFVVNMEKVVVSQFIADLYEIIEPLQTLLVGIVQGDYEPPNEFHDDMAPIETEVDEWIDSMETAPTINVEDIETEVDKVTDFETDANYLSILSGIFLNEAFLMMFTWCVILAMLGFILYGKR